MREFANTSDIPVHKTLIEQVLGQEEACTIIRQAARQRRHVLLVGDHGIGKSMLGQAMAELIEITNPDPVPCDFVLVLAGNIADLEKIHPALRSRVWWPRKSDVMARFPILVPPACRRCWRPLARGRDKPASSVAISANSVA